MSALWVPVSTYITYIYIFRVHARVVDLGLSHSVKMHESSFSGIIQPGHGVSRAAFYVICHIYNDLRSGGRVNRYTHRRVSNEDEEERSLRRLSGSRRRELADEIGCYVAHAAIARACIGEMGIDYRRRQGENEFEASVVAVAVAVVVRWRRSCNCTNDREWLPDFLYTISPRTWSTSIVSKRDFFFHPGTSVVGTWELYIRYIYRVQEGLFERSVETLVHGAIVKCHTDRWHLGTRKSFDDRY